jgi:hypothetical protein
MRDASYQDIENILYDCQRLTSSEVGICWSSSSVKPGWIAYVSLADVRATGETPMEAAMNLKAKLEAIAYRDRYQSELLARTLGLEAAE